MTYKSAALEAYTIVSKVINKGSAKDGANESWRTKPASYHLKKGANHANLAVQMYLGEIPPDNEGWKIHAYNAITRLAMGIICTGYFVS